jgi:hypothetical protein
LRDWTQTGVSELSLWFRGGFENNAEPLYVALANLAGVSVVVAHEDANAARSSAWTKWTVPLQVFTDQGIDLSNVDQITIGLGSQSGIAIVGGTGTVYIDDIRLYRP